MRPAVAGRIGFGKKVLHAMAGVAILLFTKLYGEYACQKSGELGAIGEARSCIGRQHAVIAKGFISLFAKWSGKSFRLTGFLRFFKSK